MVSGVIGSGLVLSLEALVTWTEMGTTGIWTGIAISNVLALVIAGLSFLHGIRTDAVIDAERSAFTHR